MSGIDSDDAVKSQGNSSADTASDTSSDKEGVPESKTKRILQSIGAVIVTGLVFYFIFGIPGYLLFGMFFD